MYFSIDESNKGLINAASALVALPTKYYLHFSTVVTTYYLVKALINSMTIACIFID